MNKRIGFACKYMHPDQNLKPKILKEHEQPFNCRATTVRWLNEHKSEAEDRLWELMQHNIQSVYNLVEYVSKQPDALKMVRISSPVLPVATEATWKYFWSKPDVVDYCEKHFAPIGELARREKVRLSMHPGQFTVLASESEDIVNRSIEEFEYHATMARYMGYGKSFQDFKINVHISGRKGPAGIQAVMPRLSQEARNTITIENDEMSWGIEASLELCRDLALVLDIHHHWVKTGEYIEPTDDRFLRIVDSWRGVRPVIHYSISRDEYIKDIEGKPNFDKLLEQGFKKAKLRAHSDWYNNETLNDWALSFWQHADIMCESKAKNLASKQVYNRAMSTNLI
mgnify:FL=1